MKTLKTGILTVIIAFYCSLNVQAQENARGKLKGKVVKSSDTGMISVAKDTLSNPTLDSGKKGLNAVNVKLARGVDKKDIRRTVGVSPDTIANPALRKVWDGSVKVEKTDGQMQEDINTSTGRMHKIKIDDHPDAKAQVGSGTSDESLKKGINEGGLKKNEGEKMDSEFMSKKGYDYYKAQSDNTVSKQTQGATFGEKVNQGLHQAGGAISQGASVKENESRVENDSIPSASSERAINESGVSVKSNKPKK